MNQEYVRDDLPIWKGCDGLGDVPDKPEYVGRGETLDRTISTMRV